MSTGEDLRLDSDDEWCQKKGYEAYSFKHPVSIYVAPVLSF